jgi:phosphopantothenoylcysteine decarboxylase/phosphopantothenate--cysteine ligase
VARLLLGVTGGIAAYKALEVVRLATRAGHSVRVLQTESSLRFVGRASFTALTGAPVLVGDSDADSLRGAYPGDPLPPREPISHLAVAEAADVFLIAPASANTIAKLAHGLADSLLTEAALVARCPVLVAPAMNSRMYEHPATRANLELLGSRGVTIIQPGEGELASHGEHGVGRLAEPAELLAACQSALAAEPLPAAASWRGRRVLVTAGGTREPIDSVRFIGNRSSGRMGLALAEQALRRGAEVILVTANVALPPPADARVLEVSTAAELADACRNEFPSSDVLLMAAAVADFRPRDAADHKLKKDQGVPQIQLQPTEDVLSALAAERRPGQVLVGFAAETGERAISYGQDKLKRKRLDAIVVNDVAQPGIGFDAPDNAVTVLTAAGRSRNVPRAGKGEVAAAVLDEVGQLLAEKENRDRTLEAQPGQPARV